MKLYKVIGKKLISVEVEKETKCFYFLKNRIAAFRHGLCIAKTEAMLTPQQAIQEALNKKRTMQKVLSDKLTKIKTELNALEDLQKKY